MRQVEMSGPLPVFVAPHGRSATIEAHIIVDPDQRLEPDDLDALLCDVQSRIAIALDGLFEGLPASAVIGDVTMGFPAHIPMFPATFGDRAYEDQADVWEAIDQLRKGTPLEGLLYDCRGRAFTLSVWANFRREPGQDRGISEIWTLDPLENHIAQVEE